MKTKMRYNYQMFPTLNATFPNKEKLVSDYVAYMLCRTQSMFQYSGLPDTIPARYLELYLQTNGNCCIAEANGKLYAFTGGAGGVPDEYYRPTVYIVANPYLKLNKEYRINEDCVVIRNDSLKYGLMPMFSRYSSLLAENDVTMRISDINCRITSLLIAANDSSAAGAKEYLKQIEAGQLGILSDNTSFIEGIKSQPYGNSTQTNSLTDLIEYHQYLKASWFNDLGLNANYNMKRESINSNEAQLNDDCLLPLVDDMLRNRQEGIEKVNQMFGTQISVTFNSAWAKEQVEAYESVSDQAEDMPTEETGTDETK